MLQEIFNLQNYHFNPLAIPSLTTGFYCILLGLFSYLKNKRIEGFVFFLMNLFMAIWLLGFSLMYNSLNERVAFFWDKIGYAGVIFISVSTYLFSVVLLKIKKEKKIVFLGYLIMLSLIHI